MPCAWSDSVASTCTAREVHPKVGQTGLSKSSAFATLAFLKTHRRAHQSADG